MRALRQLVWEGSVSVRIRLAANETRSSKSQDYLVSVPVILATEHLVNQLQAPRISYLPNHLPQVVEYFTPYLNDPKCAAAIESWWFDFEGVPIKWNWPIGLAYDLLTGHDPKNTEPAGDNPSSGRTSISVDSEPRNDAHSSDLKSMVQLERQPDMQDTWTITLHWKDYPAEYVLTLESAQTWQDYWLNQAKEACYMRHGTAKSLMNLSKDDTTQLLQHVATQNFEGYWEIMDRILGSNHAIRSFPIKIYFPGSNTVHQALIKPKIEGSTTPVTLGVALNHHFPGLFPSKRTCITARPMIHGVAVPLIAPIIDLLDDMMYTDGFLHIAIVMMS